MRKIKKHIKNFLVLYFPWPLKAYYKRKHRHDIYKLLKFFHEYRETGSDLSTAYHVMRLDHGWDIKKTGRIMGICVYLNLLAGGGFTPKKSIYEKKIPARDIKLN